MRGWTQIFLSVLAVTSLLALLIVLGRAGLELGALGGELVRTLELAFPRGPWRSATQITGGMVAVAFGLSALRLLLSVGTRSGTPQFESLSVANVREVVGEVSRRVEACVARPQPYVVGAIDELIRGAVATHASDIHLSPTPDGLTVTYRVHGTLHEIVRLDPGLSAPLSTRVKVLARLDTFVSGVPQDGRLVHTLDGRSIEARVSTLPTETGERVVLRLVRGSVAVPDIESLGFSVEVARGLAEVLAKPQGLLFVTGPVGSGKTTTLYAAMKHIQGTRGSMTTMVTLEDPIELELPFATQTQMKPKAGMTFAGTLRSVLRQDPNVLMVGEIRDHETADIAAQAGLTGHLLLTTVHGESAAGPFARLMEMRVEPFVVASASLACLSQRLVRVLCTACRKRAEPEPIHRERLARLGLELPAGQYFSPVGCEYCEGQGFTGRMPVAELLLVTPEVREAINRRARTNEIYELAVTQGMTPLVRAGLELAGSGTTSLTEVLRVAG